MRAILDGPLATLLTRDNHVYRDHHVAVKPTSDQLEAQLEVLWTGVDTLSYTRKRGLLQLIMRIQRRSTMENQWASLLSAASDVTPDEDDLPDGPSTKAALKTDVDAAAIHFNSDARKLLNELATKHAYVATVTLAVIERAKIESGVLQSSDFLWTRTRDPLLWQMINGFGRPRQFASVVGVFAHYEYEKRHGRSPDTKFEDAVVWA